MQTNSRLEFLTGLRGWAAVIVLFHHTLYFLLSRLNPLFAGKLFAFATSGPLAVLVFFVLSGFVLSIGFMRAPEKGSLAVAVTARYFRLVVPVAVASFVAYLLLSFGWMFNGPAALVAPDIHGANAWLASFYQFAPSFKSFAQFAFYNVFFDYKEPIYNSNLWTMPYEFAGSMLIYFIVAVFRRDKTAALFPLPVLIACAVFFRVEPRIACFLFGYFLAEIYHRWGDDIEQWKYSGWVFGIMAVLPVIATTFINMGAYVRLSSLLAVMLVAAAIFCAPLRKFFDCRLSRFLGRISFPLYLMHIIVICSLSSYLLTSLPQRGMDLLMTSYVVAAVTIVVSFGAAWVFSPVEILSVHVSKRIAQRLMQKTKFIA